MQMAELQGVIAQIALCYEFTGTYRLPSQYGPDRKFSESLPLTDMTRLGAFIDQATNLKGRRCASRALPYVLEGSASPMETALGMLINLPFRLGGYNFEAPLLNYPLNRLLQFKDRLGDKPLRCDFLWPEYRLGMEYDSDAEHLGSAELARDSARRNALTAAGLRVITVTRPQIMDTARLRKVAEELAELMGRRLRIPKDGFAARHAELRQQVLPRLSADREP